jgi:hypothetical protein
MIKESDIAGVIYPLNKSNFILLQHRKNPMYVKYIIHTNSKKPTTLVKGNFLFFYISKANKSIVGYSKINEITFKNYMEIKKDFIENIQMRQEDFDKYSFKRENKPLICLKLDTIIEFNQAVTINFPMTMTGKYVTKDKINFFFKSDIKMIY